MLSEMTWQETREIESLATAYCLVGTIEARRKAGVRLLNALLKAEGAFRANLQVGLHHDPDSEYQVDWTVWGVPDEHRGQFMNPSSVHQILIVPVPKEGNDDEAPS